MDGQGRWGLLGAVCPSVCLSVPWSSPPPAPSGSELTCCCSRGKQRPWGFLDVVPISGHLWTCSMGGAYLAQSSSAAGVERCLLCSWGLLLAALAAGNRPGVELPLTPSELQASANPPRSFP